MQIGHPRLYRSTCGTVNARFIVTFSAELSWQNLHGEIVPSNTQLYLYAKKETAGMQNAPQGRSLEIRELQQFIERPSGYRNLNIPRRNLEIYISF